MRPVLWRLTTSVIGAASSISSTMTTGSFDVPAPVAERSRNPPSSSLKE
jgi:hypothetical protein